ncbi:hypothetical protein [Qipengyuania spongiae]|uniref:Uncharacterized protein n=1 Tax=Qipengyuania spongiae TaxID=2909673 RepID=A0ABY5SV83_9SPHN|nr:hypothetical protein [Qipengyuania spongiae]UVI38407.1 hypothetical protein L1F33_09045 [Qipengyuania spongiae]
MTFSIFLIALAAFMRFGPDIPFKHVLNHHLVEKPLTNIMRRERHKYIFLIGATAMFLLGPEIIILFGPEMVLAYAADLALYIDIVAISALSNSFAEARQAFKNWRTRSILLQRIASVLHRRPAPTSRARRKIPATDSSNDNVDDVDRMCRSTARYFAIAA